MQQLYIFFQFFFVTTTVILEEYFINIIDVIGKNSHLPSRWLKWHVGLLCLYRRDLLERWGSDRNIHMHQQTEE